MVSARPWFSGADIEAPTARQGPSLLGVRHMFNIFYGANGKFL